jgi:aspartyl-tRNA(Asn)/glutamyl-tRNA(Gln) amidotransferase subunit C
MTSGQEHTRLGIEDVRHIARLCHVGLTDEEAERMRDQLSHILEQFQDLAAIDTTGVEATDQAVGLDSVMRKDVPVPSMPVEDVLANAPRREGDYFRVRAVMEESP